MSKVRLLARSQQISERYLEQLLILLKVAGLVRSIRGTHGGFTLAKPPSQIRLSEIIQVMEGSISPVECVEHAEVCSYAAQCETRNIWVNMKRAMIGS